MMSVMAVNTLLYSNITCHESGKPLCGSFSEPEWHTSDDAFKTTLLTHRRPQQNPVQARPSSQQTL
jgi:predicted CxxxxCH...CXXCH cytochrome family protein